MGCSCSTLVRECKETKELLTKIEELIDHLEKLNISPNVKQKNQMRHYNIEVNEQIVQYSKLILKNPSKWELMQLSLLKKHFHQLAIRWKYLNNITIHQSSRHNFNLQY